MNNKKLEREIPYINSVFIDNNKEGVINSLNTNGYPTSEIISSKDLNLKLFRLANADYQKYISVLEGVTFDPSKQNYTTSSDFVNSISQGNNVNQRSFEDIFKQITGYLTGTSSNTTTTTETGGNTLVILGSVVGVALLLGITIFALTKIN